MKSSKMNLPRTNAESHVFKAMDECNGNNTKGHVCKGVVRGLQELEAKLDSLELEKRKETLAMLLEEVRQGRIVWPEPCQAVNLHSHTFFSYNCYGYSPLRFAWLARRRGLEVAGIIDFDVLDGLEEFFEAAGLLGLKACAGMETRVFVPEFADRVINSPGEPGIAYHIGIGFPRANLEGDLKCFADRLKETAQKRNKALIDRLNYYLSPLELDYQHDVIPLTPAGNPTERHICLALARKAERLLGRGRELVQFWTEKLKVDSARLDLPEGRDFLNTIRAKTMKRGGAGYVQPDTGAFPRMDEMNRFILAAGGIPTLAWLDGTSDGEKDIEKLLNVAMESGVAAINIIPDRNFTPGVKDRKLANLYEIVSLAENIGLPVAVGTEMNSPGQKFVDDFGSQELSPLLPVFLKGAYIIYAHTVLQARGGLGYTSPWAEKNFEDRKKRNDFYCRVGESLKISNEERLKGLTEEASPDNIINEITRSFRR